MDLNDIRAWHTLLLLLIFIALWIWAWSKKRKKPFNEAANLPFADDKQDRQTIEKDHLS